MYDLIYANQLAQDRLQEIYPGATFEDASDLIHPERFTIEVKVETAAYRLTLLEERMALLSMDFQMWMRTKPDECKTMVEKWQRQEKDLTNSEE